MGNVDGKFKVTTAVETRLLSVDKDGSFIVYSSEVEENALSTPGIRNCEVGPEPRIERVCSLNACLGLAQLRLSKARYTYQRVHFRGTKGSGPLERDVDRKAGIGCHSGWKHSDTARYHSSSATDSSPSVDGGIRATDLSRHPPSKECPTAAASEHTVWSFEQRVGVHHRRFLQESKSGKKRDRQESHTCWR